MFDEEERERLGCEVGRLLELARGHVDDVMERHVQAIHEAYEAAFKTLSDTIEEQKDSIEERDLAIRSLQKLGAELKSELDELEGEHVMLENRYESLKVDFDNKHELLKDAHDTIKKLKKEVRVVKTKLTKAQNRNGKKK